MKKEPYNGPQHFQYYSYKKLLKADKEESKLQKHISQILLTRVVS
jgi:hypothetical protein